MRALLIIGVTLWNLAAELDYSFAQAVSDPIMGGQGSGGNSGYTPPGQFVVPAEIVLRFNSQELVLLSQALGELPKKVADPLFAKLQEQIRMQLVPVQPAPK